MVFSSTVFLFLFLPAVLIINHLLQKRYRNTFLLLGSLFFYAWGEGVLVLLMLFSISVNYMGGLGVAYFLKNRPPIARGILGLAITANLLLLVYYKYANFLLENLQLAGFFSTYAHQSILLPIGISFFTFQGISYLVDVYRQETDVQRNIFHLGLYISFFPQLIAGPIVRYHDVAEQIRSRVTTQGLFSEGVIRFTRGLAKKMLIANNAAFIADQVFAVPALELSALSSWLGIICYTLQIYFDFSGYSDMAIGLGKMLGFNFKENFNYPYISKSIQEFWRRWHISLSTWFRDYLYIPLGGNRGGKVFTYRNLIIVFFITGLWHGASWNFVIWGLFHGLFLILERARVIRTTSWPAFFSHLYVLLVVIVGWILFRTETLMDSFHYLKSMLGMSAVDNQIALIYLDYYTGLMLLLGVLFSMPLRKRLFGMIFALGGKHRTAYSLGIYTLHIALLILSVIELAQSGYNPFIYFRF